MIQGITNFKNPENLGFDLSFDFDTKPSSGVEQTKEKEETQQSKVTTNSDDKNVEKPNETPPSGNDNVDKKDDDGGKSKVSVTDDGLDSLFGFGADLKKDQERDGNGGDSKQSSDVDEKAEQYVQIINSVADVFGGKLIPYDGFSEEEVPNEEMLNKLLVHNLEVAQDNAVSEFVESLSPEIQKLIDFDLNLDEGENNETKLRAYIQDLIKTKDVASLSLENINDQERIVRTFYENEQWSEDEVNEKIKDLKDTNLLTKEATRLKPKLVAKYEEGLREKETKERELKEADKALKQNFNREMFGIVGKGKINDISLTKDEVEKVMTYLSTETKEYRTPTGGTKTMTPIEAVINYYRYAQGADKTVLAEVALYLSDPAGFKEKFRKKIESELSSNFVKEQKYNTRSLSGLNVDKKADSQNTEKQAPPKWKLKI